MNLRTQDEIVTKLKGSNSFFGFDSEVLVPYLDFEHAKPFLKPEASAETWPGKYPSREEVLAEAKKYMEEIGWPKVEDHRGISANRTIEKMEAWIWMLGEDELLRRVTEVDYPQYGAPKLKVICEHFGWPIPADPAIARMIDGDPCRPGCESGCGQ